MEVQLTSDQEAFIRHAIESGRLHRKEDAVQEAMSLWEDRERRRLEILAAVDQAEASLARGEGRRITTQEDVTQLAYDIKRRGMARSPPSKIPADELDGIWMHIARDSVDIATRVVENITRRLWLLARHPYIGRRRDDDLRPGPLRP